MYACYSLILGLNGGQQQQSKRETRTSSCTSTSAIAANSTPTPALLNSNPLKRRRQSTTSTGTPNYHPQRSTNSPAKRLHLDANLDDSSLNVDLNNVSNVRNYSNDNSRASSRSSSSNASDHHRLANGNSERRGREEAGEECTDSDMLTDDLDHEEEDDEEDDDQSDSNESKEEGEDEDEEEEEGEGESRVLRRSVTKYSLNNGSTAVCKKIAKEAIVKSKKTAKENLLNGNSRNRLCSMPGYNMLSENEKKVTKNKYFLYSKLKSRGIKLVQRARLLRGRKKNNNIKNRTF